MTSQTGINHLGPYLSARPPKKGEKNPPNQLPLVTASETVVRLQPVSSVMKIWIPPMATWVIPEAPKAARKAMASTNQP